MRKFLWLFIVILLCLSAVASAPAAYGAGETIPPQVIETTPFRGAELPLSSPITFYFDQPMDKASVEKAFKASPAVQGQFRWTDDLTLLFQPAQPLSRAAEY